VNQDTLAHWGLSLQKQTNELSDVNEKAATLLDVMSFEF
jgi:hypothetical protein